MHETRLLKLADALDANAKNRKGIKFDLEKWGSADDGAISKDCGTTACAMGIAVISGIFRREGLHNYYSNRSGCLAPAVGTKYGFEAAETLFEISKEQAYYLFSNEKYPRGYTKSARGEKYVASRIRTFVRTGGVIPERWT